MDSPYPTYDDSGHCDLANTHKFVPVFDNGGQVGIFCIYCDYVLFEHIGCMYVTPAGELIESVVDQVQENNMSKTRRRSTNTDAVFVGWQKMSSGEEFPLYNITAESHPAKGSTVSNDTLRKLKLQIPTTPAPQSGISPAQNQLNRVWRKILFRDNEHPLHQRTRDNKSAHNGQRHDRKLS